MNGDTQKTVEYSIFDLGFNQFLARPLSPLGGPLEADLGLPTSMRSDFYSTAPNNIASGELTQNITMVGGYLRSSNFVTGSAGWQIAYGGDVEFNSGTFRGNLIAGAIYIPNQVSPLAQILSTGVATFKSITLDTSVIIKDLQAGSVVDGQYINALSVAKLTTGTISSKQITLGITAGTGDSYIAAGKTDFDNTVSGFILGLDDSDSDLAKFYIGSSTKYLNWDGTDLTIQGNISGSTITGSTLTTGTTGDNITLTQGRMSQRSNLVEVAYSDVGSNGGWFGLKDVNGVGIGHWSVRNSETDINFICDVGDLYIQAADDILFVGSAGNDIYPVSNNAMSLGLGSNKWSDVQSVLINGADYCFDNNFRISEEEDFGIAFYNQRDEKIMVLDDRGFIWLKGLVLRGIDMDEIFPFYRKGMVKINRKKDNGK